MSISATPNFYTVCVYVEKPPQVYPGFTHFFCPARSKHCWPNSPTLLAAGNEKFKTLSKTQSFRAVATPIHYQKNHVFFSSTFKSRKYRLYLVLFGRSSTCPLTTMCACSHVRVRVVLLEPLIFVQFPFLRFAWFSRLSPDQTGDR